MKRIFSLAIALYLTSPTPAPAAAEPGEAAQDDVYFATAAGQTEADEYTRYELLAPETASFKIYYEVSAATAGARFYYNPIRKGSSASDESVYDAMLGTPLHFEVVSGAQARKDPLMPDADLGTHYIKVGCHVLCRNMAAAASSSSKPTRMRTATMWTARPSSSIGRWA